MAIVTSRWCRVIHNSPILCKGITRTEMYGFFILLFICIFGLYFIREMIKQSGIKLDTQKFISRSIQIHGNRYDYSLVDYKNAKTIVNIICSEHGVFTQTPDKHYLGRGCPECGKLKGVLGITKTQDKFINECRIIHNDKYDYTKTVYTRSCDYVTITCPTHGDFNKIANKHFLGEGCQICGQTNKNENRSKIILEKRFKDVDQPKDYKLIPLNTGDLVMVDNHDFSILKDVNWTFKIGGYAHNPRLGSMHRFITNCPKGMVIDHINGNGLDNRRSNLRVCTQKENTRNQKSRIGYSSKYKGVCWNKNRNKWHSQIKCNFKNISIGFFSCEIESAKAYDKKAKELFGEFAKTNF